MDNTSPLLKPHGYTVIMTQATMPSSSIIRSPMIFCGQGKAGSRQLAFLISQHPKNDKRIAPGAVIPIECHSLNPAWIGQVADATRQAVKCR